MFKRVKRLFRHAWLEQSSTHRVVPPAMVERLRRQVASSEKLHTGEIRIYVETALPLNYLWHRASTAVLARRRALALFGELGVWDTANNNGVLIYLLLAEHAIEIVADRGVDAKAGSPVWAGLAARMSTAFQHGRFEEGLRQAMEEVSAVLAMHFPAASGVTNPNELPDRPIIR
jgi:uncharacterized membrane protein